MHSELLSVYADIIKGYSRIEQNLHAVFKHPGPLEISVLEEERISFQESAKNQGLPTEKEQLEHLEKESLWTKKDEEEIRDLQMMLRGLRDSKEKLALKSQVAIIKDQIAENEKKLQELDNKKRELLGLTIESITNKQANEFFIWYTLFKDATYNEHFLTRYEFNCLSNQELAEIIIAQSKSVGKFTTQNLKKISLSGYFTNAFYLAEDNPFTFYGKPLIHLSNYQIELFGLGRYYKSLVTQHEGKIPDELYEDPDAFVEWVTTAKNAKKLLDKAGDNEAVGIVGATKDDLKHINAPVLDLAKEAQKRGGRLTMKDMLELHG